VRRESLLRIVASLGALSLAAYACTTDTGEKKSFGEGLPPGAGGTSNEPRAGTSGASASGGNATGGNATGGNATGGNATAGTIGTGGTIVITVDASDAKDELTEDAACGSGMAEATLLPVNIMMMFDRSGSMTNDQDEPTRWTTATTALRTFFEAPAAEGLGVALRFFPDDLPAEGCTAVECDCDPVACTEVLVEMGTLTADAAPTDVQEGALIQAIEGSHPDRDGDRGGGSCDGDRGNTPIHPALDGALRWATTYQSGNADQKTVVVFVTDGDPAGGCTDDYDEIDALAADALAAAGINTYVIGLTDENGEGLNQDELNGLAVSGGTTEAFFVSDGPMASEQLLNTFNAIRGMELSCDFAMPEATDEGDTIDPELVNVTFTPPAPAEPVTFTKVADAAGCDTALSWYYDDETAPTRIYLCPAACEAVTTVEEASVGILVGCKPIIEPPH
jgi:hypothetical protein